MAMFGNMMGGLASKLGGGTMPGGNPDNTLPDKSNLFKILMQRKQAQSQPPMPQGQPQMPPGMPPMPGQGMPPAPGPGAMGQGVMGGLSPYLQQLLAGAK